MKYMYFSTLLPDDYFLLQGPRGFILLGERREKFSDMSPSSYKTNVKYHTLLYGNEFPCLRFDVFKLNKKLYLEKRIEQYFC